VFPLAWCYLFYVGWPSFFLLFLSPLLYKAAIYFYRNYRKLPYPSEVRSTICSTNPVESINRKVEDAEQESGGYFHSLDNVKMKLGILAKKLHLKRWKKLYYKIASVSHLLKLEFKTIFEEKDNKIQTQTS